MNLINTNLHGRESPEATSHESTMYAMQHRAETRIATMKCTRIEFQKIDSRVS
jgi:hypothetical protein